MARGFKSGGRKAGTPNKATAELRKYAQQYDRPMIDALVNIALNVKVVEGENKKPKTVPADYEDRARVVAATKVLEFGHGKPPQAITGPDGEALEVPQAVTFVIKKAQGADRR